jgi:hypothetical protein
LQVEELAEQITLQAAEAHQEQQDTVAEELQVRLALILRPLAQHLQAVVVAETPTAQAQLQVMVVQESLL